MGTREVGIVCYVDSVREGTECYSITEWERRKVGIVCYADNGNLITDNEVLWHFQRPLFEFHKACMQFGLKISTSETKTLTVSEGPLRCKLEHQGQVTEQVNFFNYLRVIITSRGILARKLVHHANKAANVSACLNKTIWLSRFLRKK